MNANQENTLRAQEGQLASLNDLVSEVKELKAQAAELSQLVIQLAKLNQPSSELVVASTGD